jgi:hypothetical protein
MPTDGALGFGLFLSPSEITWRVDVKHHIAAPDSILTMAVF